MAAFAKGLYDAAAYSSFRPVYPRRLYDAIWMYHRAGKGQWRRALDLGCGTGQATTIIARRFNETIGIDPSTKMVAQATEQLKGQRISRQLPDIAKSGNSGTGEDVPAEDIVSYRQSAAEDLSFLEDSSVDFVSAAQAVHWFDHAKLWRELSRVVRPGGTVAFWGYSEFRIKDHPYLTPLITYYSQGSNPTTPEQLAALVKSHSSPKVEPEENSLSAYWEQPGRSILDTGLTTVASPPTETFDPAEAKVLAFVGSHRDDVLEAFKSQASNERTVEQFECILDKKMTWELMERYCRTWSSWSNYLDKFPQEREAGEKGQGIIQRFLGRLKDEMQKQQGHVPEEFVIEWPVIVLLYRRRA